MWANSDCLRLPSLKLTLEIAAETPSRLADGQVNVIPDNVKQLKFKAESTKFEE